MFKVESYITPYLLGYIDKYVKLKQEDFQLSLWGGDAVLNKLDLRLDVLESALKLPITFTSGHIHELRLHVPWTKLGSEPVVITINTIECVLKLRDSAHDETETTSVKSNSSATKQPVKTRPQKTAEGEELPPGYLQSIVNRILHNVNIVVNNLILKFVEDDIVLSVNVKSAECYSVNKDWSRSFIDLTLPELVLRRVVDFQDLTICLDKRNASGKIEMYQDPLLYRCSLTCRCHMTYDSLHAKLPTTTKLNILCEKLDLSLTDTQVPMFFRLVELCVALYYGTLEVPGGDRSEADDSAVGEDAVLVQAPLESPSHHPPGDQLGWGAWAWSYVPQVLPSGEWEDSEDEDEISGVKKKPEPAVLAIGVYINKAQILFKLTEYVRESPYYTPQKTQFKPCLIWEADAIGLEVLLRGISFFNVQLGISSTRVLGMGDAMCGFKDLDQGTRDPCFLRGGYSPDGSTLRPSYHLSQSLFDPGGRENMGDRASFLFDGDEHLERYTEHYALQKYGMFWMDYLFTMEDLDNGEGGSRSSVSNKTNEDQDVKEKSSIRFLLGPAQLNISSSMVQRVHKFIHCMNDHEYEPYAKPKTDEVEECLPPKSEVVRRLEEFIPTRSYHLTITKPTICLMAADLPDYDVSKKKIVSSRRAKKSKSKSTDPPLTSPPALLPTLVLQADRFDLQTTSAMYPKFMVKVVSKLPAPPSNLLHHCHAHMYIKVFGLQVGLTAIDPSRGMYPLQPLLQPMSAVFYKKSLIMPKYWKNPLQPRLEQMYELPQLTVSLTKPQVLALAQIASSWKQATPSPARLQSISLLSDIFKSRTPGRYPILECAVSGLELKICYTEAVTAATGSLTSLQAMLLYSGDANCPVTPILYGPVETSSVHDMELFTGRIENPQEADVQRDLMTFTLQLPTNPNLPQAPATVLLDIQGLSVCVDPMLHEWMAYRPIVKPTKLVSQDPGAKETDPKTNIDSVLLEATSPLKRGSHESQSESTVTNPTDSQPTPSQTQTSQPPSHTPHPTGSHPIETGPEGGPSQQAWGKTLSQLFPAVKMMELQVDIRSWCMFFPEKHVPLSEPSVDIPAGLQGALQRGVLPETLVVVLPAVHIVCAGHRAVSTSQEIPIKSMEQSLAGDKLPWSVKLHGGSIYTIHQSAHSFYVLDPVSLAGTVAVTTKYNPPLSDNIQSLSLCVHADIQTVTVRCSKPQLQLAYSLLIEYVKSITKILDTLQLVKELHEKGLKAAVPMDNLPPSVPALPSKKGTSSSPPPELPDMVLNTITETSETMSHADVDKQTDSSDDVKLSLWLQWTLVKFVCKLYVKDRDVLLSAELEDVTSAIDVQDVFSKVKCKVGGFTIEHFTKRENKWVPGSYQGMILSSNGQLMHNIPIATNKVWTNKNEAVSHMFNMEDPKPSDNSLGFLSLTFTRALQTNIKKRLRKANIADGINEEEEDQETQKPKEPDDIYLNEICLTIQPCDVVLNLPVVGAALSIASLNWSKHDFDLHQKSHDHSPPCDQSQVTKQTSMPLLTSSFLPLLYLNMGHFRGFLPSCSPSSHESGSSGSSTYSDPFQMTPEESMRNVTIGCETDMFVVQIASIALKPHADNPLPRNIVDKEVYRKALHAGITTQPGSTIEDRQYQMDIEGLSLCSGNWGELVAASKPALALTKGPSVQNPALEWNTLKTNAQGEIEEMRLTPVASSFDLKIVAAPAVVYSPRPSTDRKPVLVCGYSLEVNATTDMDYCVSVQQIHLIHQLYVHNLTPLLSAVTDITSPRLSDGRDGHYPNDSMSSVDSGIESEVSTLRSARSRLAVPPVHHGKQRESSPPPAEKKPYDWSEFTPFDFLLTAGKISFMLYSIPEKTPEIKTLEITSEIEGFEEVKSLKIPVLMPFMTPGDAPGSKPSSTPSSLKPFLYAYFSQPHSLISCLRDSQKAELSCFDIVLKGCKPGYVVQDAGRVVPEPADYMVHWIETRPGRADPKTGIPPSLYTLRVTDMLQQPAKIDLCIERPLRINLSTAKLEESLRFYDLIVSGISTTPSEKNVPKSSPTKSTGESLPAFLTTFTLAGDLHLHLDQLVVAMETCEEAETFAVQLAFSQVDSDTVFIQQDKGYVEEITTTANIQDLVIRTTYRGLSRPLIGPFTSSLSVGLQWCVPHSGGPGIPQVLVFWESGYVAVNVGQEHIMCLENMANNLTACLSKLGSDSDKSQSDMTCPDDPKRSKVSLRSVGAGDKSTDDLRTGEFVYVSDDMGVDLLPATYEVVFGVDTELGQATMTWCYPVPRAVTYLKVMPIPFTLPQQFQADLVDETLRVPCLLQYWNVLARRFDSYLEFSVSENQPTEIKLPELTADYNPDIVVSGVWRVLVLHPDYLQTRISHGDIEPLVSPMSLAASVHVDSVSAPGYVPVLQCAVSSTMLDIRLFNHLLHLSHKPWSKLHPFRLDESSPSDHEVAALVLDQPAMAASYLQGKQHRFLLNGGTGLRCDVLDYRSLTMLTLLEPAAVNVSVHYTQGQEWQKLWMDLGVDELSLKVSPSIVHTVSMAALAFTQMKSQEVDRIIPHYYILCNDTQQAIRIGQCDTDESIVLQSREAHPYSWRSHKRKQLLQICTEGLGWSWCDPLPLDKDQVTTRTIKSAESTATLIIRVKQLTNCQKQVTISGQVIIASRLTRQLDVRLLSTTVTKETTSTLKPMETLPSYVIEHNQVRAIKVKLEGVKTSWSQEIPITGDKVKGSRLVKVPLQDKKGYVHIWCHIFTQQHKRAAQNLILLTPLFVVRTQLPTSLLMNIDTPRLQSGHQVALEGCGMTSQLHMMGGDMTHNITFQLSPSMKPSSPAIALSSGLIDQVQQQRVDRIDMEQLIYEWRHPGDDTWPYNKEHSARPQELEYIHHQDIMIPQQSAPAKPTPTTQRSHNYPANQPNIDLQINLGQLWPGCNTLLIDVVPYWLLDNQSGADLILIGREKGQEVIKQWKVGQGQTFAPPSLEGSFELGVMWGYMLHQSEGITLSPEDNRSRYLPDVPGLLYLHSNLLVNIPVIKDGAVTKVCYLSLHSTVHQGMRILTTRERYCLSNMTPWPLQYQCLSLTLTTNKIDPSKEQMTCHSLGSSTGSHPHSLEGSGRDMSRDSDRPILLWDIPASESAITDFLPSSGHKPPDHVQYMTFRLSQGHTEDKSNTGQGRWSHPVRIKLSDNGTRQTVGLFPSDWDPLSVSALPGPTRPCTVTAQTNNHVVYLIIHEDPDPPIEIHNNSPIPLCIGQTLIDAGLPGAEVQEEAELTTSLHTVYPYTTYPYAFPSANSKYPDITKTKSPLRLHFASAEVINHEIEAQGQSTQPLSDEEIDELGQVKVQDKGQAKPSMWSSGVDLESKHDTFVSVPHGVDVKVHTEHVGHTVHVFVDPVSRAEISAKEIRSRIKGKETVHVETTHSSPSTHTGDLSGSHQGKDTPETKSSPGGKTPVSRRPSTEHATSAPLVRPKRPIILEIQINTLVKRAIFALVEDTPIRELLRVTADHIFIVYTPEDVTKALTTRHTHFLQRLMLGVMDVQIDNQFYSRGSYDFPVVMVRQDWSEKRVEPLPFDKFLGLSKQDKWREVKRCCLMYASLQVCNDVTKGHTSLTRVNMASEPVTTYIEDIFIYNLITFIDKIIPTALVTASSSGKHQRTPQSVICGSRQLNSPVRLHRLSVEPMALLVSIHASLKLFIASDNTPLTFGHFERRNLFTSFPQVVRSLAMHYASGALFRAGWVVGSLDILGSPTGLVRSIGNGVADLFRLPYEGFTRGPGAFVGGVTRGMGSLLRHISTGTLTSITNFASSVSRNMDRLSLDMDHCERQTEGRKHKPEGLSQGLVNGLTGFGLSLLGAVAGLADQPLQSLTPDLDSQLSATQAATGLVSGVGKGLVGMVTKPIGGAAELVSQTGLGLLKGTGLSQFPLQRHQAADRDTSTCENGTSKYLQKMVQSIPKPDILVCVDGRQVAGQTEELHVVLILTPEVVFVMSADEDVQLQAFTLTEIVCQEDEWDVCTLSLAVKDTRTGSAKWMGSHLSSDRVAEFIDKAALYTPITSQDTELEDQSESSKKHEDQSDGRRQLESSSQSETRIQNDSQSDGTKKKVKKSKTVIGPYYYHMDPRLRELFVAMFNMASDRAAGYGFNM